MKEESDVIRVTKWIDGELKDAEIRDLLAENPELKGDRQAMSNMGEMVRDQFPPEMEVPFPEAFNRQVLRKIEEENEKSLEAKVVRFFNWVSGSEWALPAAAAATLLALLVVGLQFNGVDGFRSEVVHTFAPNPDHDATTAEHRRAGVTVINLEGLDPLPETEQVIGYFPTASSYDPMIATTTFFGENNEPLLVLTTDLDGEPRLRGLQ